MSSSDQRTPSRREILHGAQALGIAILAPRGLAGCGSDPSPAGPFQHGVASGDPLPDGVILWTRVTPDGDGPVPLTWQLASDPGLEQIVASGTAETDADRDFTVKVDARGLEPGQTYYYRFDAAGGSSPIGRTRTAPAAGVQRARFGVASCSSHAQGYFHAYRALAGRADLDAVIHLGDYIYESGPGEFGSARSPEPPHETVTLADYRARHAQYKRDPDLQEVHRQHPFIAVWDDHELTNNASRDGAENHQPETEGSWDERKAAALRAHAEWMPIREQADGRIWRTLAWGDLADLVMLDTRIWGRTGGTEALLGPPPAPDPARTLLGDDQAAWLEGQLAGSVARWKLVAQQVLVANVTVMPGTLFNLDQWHGYPESRTRLLQFLRTSGVRDVVILTGDIHSSWANELVVDPNDPTQYDPATGAGSIAVELVTPGITSPGLPPQFAGVVDAARQYNPHVRWTDLMRKGYMVLDVVPDRVQAAWFLFDDVTLPASAPESFGAAWSVRAGSTRLEQDATFAEPPAGPAPAP
jgi:alkaline phosphatase D